MSFIKKFKSLPIPTQRLLGIGVVVALVVALPLFVGAIATQKFLFNQQAATGEPTPPPVFSTPTPTPTPPVSLYCAGANGTRCNITQCPVCPPSGPCPLRPCAVIMGTCRNHVCITNNPTPPPVPTPPPAGPTPPSVVTISPTAGTLTCPATNPSNVEFSWNAAANAATYYLRIDDLNLSTGFTACGTGAVLAGDFCIPRIIGTTRKVSLPAGHNYRWWVSGFTSTGVQGTNGTPVAFSIPAVCTPSPPPTPTSRSFEIFFKFDGVADNSAEGAKVKVRFVSRSLDNDLGYETPPIPASYNNNGVYVLNFDFALQSTNLPAASDYAVFLTGEKHLHAKFCAANGQTTHCPGNESGHISLPTNPGLISLNFIGIPLPAGDTPPQDGAVNLADFSRIISLLSKPASSLTANDLQTGDLNYDGHINIQDIFLIRKTLETRYD